MVASMVGDNTDIIIASEMKPNSSFLNSQFAVEGYTTLLRYDKNCHGGGILLFIREDVLARMVSANRFLLWKHWIFKCQSIVVSIQIYQNLLWVLFVRDAIYII